MTSTTDNDTSALPSYVPRHPYLPDHPAPAVTRWLADDEPLWTAGPWKALVATARAADWSVTAFFARGRSLDSRGHLGPLTDSLSIRCRRTRNELGDEDRAVALWSRATWPVLGRKKPGEKSDEVAGEGRRTTEGTTWLWHPPMELPEGGLPVPSWKFTAAWTWTMGGFVSMATSKELRAYLKS